METVDVFICIFGCDPIFLNKMIDMALKEISLLVTQIPDKDELNRAKVQVQSTLFINLEQRPIVFEDVARQVLAVGKRQQAEYYFTRIDRVQADDIVRVARRIFSSPLALAGYGKINDMRSYNSISDTIQRQFSPKTRFRRIFG